MKRIFLIGIGLFFYGKSFGQDSTAFQLSEVTISANIHPTELRKVARNVSVITAEEIAASPVKTIDGILQYALNVDVRTRSPFNVQADISIRGGHFDQTLITIDGMKVNDPQTGHHSLNLPIPLEMIDRIEVLQGGASRVFGPSAFSGVINIITKKEGIPKLSATLGAGQHGLLLAKGAASLQRKKWTGTVAGDIMQSDGYAYNTAFDRNNVYAMLSRKTACGDLNIQIGKMENAFGASNFYFPSVFEQFERVAAGVMTVQWNQNFTNTWSSTINASYRRHTDLFDFNNFRESAPENVNHHSSKVYELEWKNRILHRLGNTALGVGIRSEGILSNRLGEQREELKPIPNYEGLFYDQELTRLNGSVFLEHQKNFNDFLVSGGVLVNLNTQFGTEFYPGIDLSYAPGEFSWYASANRAIRLPTFTELYLNTSTVKADPNLLPEKGWSYEIGTKWQKNGKYATASLFYRQTQDAIDKIKRPELNVPTMENIDNINFFGAEFLYQMKTGNNFLPNLFFNYAYLQADRKEDGFQSFYTLNYLQHKIGAGLDFNLVKNLGFQIRYTFKDRQGSYQFAKDEPIIPYADVHLVDARLNYVLGNFTFCLDANNLLDYSYFEFGFVEQPGRWLSSTIQFTLK